MTEDGEIGVENGWEEMGERGRDWTISTCLYRQNLKM